MGALALAALGLLDDFAWNTRLQLGDQLAVSGLPFPTPQQWLDPLRDPGPPGWRAFATSQAFRAYLPIAVVLVAAGALAQRALAGGSWRSQTFRCRADVFHSLAESAKEDVGRTGSRSAGLGPCAASYSIT